MEKQTKIKTKERQPELTKSITLSKDRKWLIFKTTRTDIIHVNYFNKILGNGVRQ